MVITHGIQPKRPLPGPVVPPCWAAGAPVWMLTDDGEVFPGRVVSVRAEDSPSLPNRSRWSCVGSFYLPAGAELPLNYDLDAKHPRVVHFFRTEIDARREAVAETARLIGASESALSGLRERRARQAELLEAIEPEPPVPLDTIREKKRR